MNEPVFLGNVLVFQKHLSTASELLFGKRDCWFRTIPSDNSLWEENTFQFLNFVVCYREFSGEWNILVMMSKLTMMLLLMLCSAVHWKPEFKSNTQMHSKTLLLLWTLLINLISMLPSDAMFLNSLCNVQKKTCIPQMDVVSVLLRVTFYSGLDTQFSILVKEH